MARKPKPIEERYPGASLNPEYFQPLSEPEEAQFQQWYGTWATQNELSGNPDDPQHLYNYRAWWKAMQADPKTFAPQLDPGDGRMHSPSLFKAFNHPTRYQADPIGRLYDGITGEVFLDPMPKMEPR